MSEIQTRLENVLKAVDKLHARKDGEYDGLIADIDDFKEKSKSCYQELNLNDAGELFVNIKKGVKDRHAALKHATFLHNTIERDFLSFVVSLDHR